MFLTKIILHLVRNRKGSGGAPIDILMLFCTQCFIKITM